MQEKRAQKRFDLQIVSRLRYAARAHSDQAVEAVSRDISSIGAFFITPDTLPLGASLVAEIILPVSRLEKTLASDSMLKCVGTVVRKDADGVAVHFDKSCVISPARKDLH